MCNMVGYIFLLILGIMFLMLIAAVVRTVAAGKKRPAPALETDKGRADNYAEILAKMVREDTVSIAGSEDYDKFNAFHNVMRQLFQCVFKTCEVHEIDGCLLLKWAGKSSEKPVCFLAHMDVVEVNPEDWTYPPFSGTIVDGKIYGRGSGDTKCSLMAAFQAVEESIAEGIAPEYDIWLASSCCEETGGPGAAKLAKYLKDNGIRLALLCDEGGAISEEPVSGVKGLYAMVGVYEKGYADICFTARSNGGHSSTPPRNTPISRLAKLITYIDKHPPFKYKFTPEVEATFRAVAPYSGFKYRLVLGNLWLFKPVLLPVLRGTTAGAMLGTTCVFTMAKGSNGGNVIPQAASVNANLRFSPWDKAKEVEERLSEIAQKYDIEVAADISRDATNPVNFDGSGYKMICAAENAVFGDIPVIPYVVTGGTDARHFEEVSNTVMRFSPVIYGHDALGRMHGIDEYLEYYCLPHAVDYYKYVINHCIEL